MPGDDIVEAPLPATVAVSMWLAGALLEPSTGWRPPMRRLICPASMVPER
jgi:hypothetical protein